MDASDELILLLNEPVAEDMLPDIEVLFKRGADVNATDSLGNRPIHLAILKSPSNSKLVLKLISHGAHLNVENQYGSTPLKFSIVKRCYKTSEILLKRGIDFDLQSQRGWSALILASMNGDLTAVSLLLKHGANPNKYDINRKTALMFACEANYLGVIKELLAYGANPGMRDCNNKTALHYCLEREYARLYIINELLLHCACFSDLGINVEDSFWKIMDKCLRGKQPYHVCVRTIIKIQMLLTDRYNYLIRYNNLYNFAVSCSSESRFMANFSGVGYGTVRTLLKKCLAGYMPKESELEALLPYLANKSFPIYSDMLRALVTKQFLRKKFVNMFMYAKRESQGDVITLNIDAKLQILSYLSDEDVSSFVMAFYVNLQKKLSK